MKSSLLHLTEIMENYSFKNFCTSLSIQSINVVYYLCFSLTKSQKWLALQINKWITHNLVWIRLCIVGALLWHGTVQWVQWYSNAYCTVLADKRGNNPCWKGLEWLPGGSELQKKYRRKKSRSLLGTGEKGHFRKTDRKVLELKCI